MTVSRTVFCFTNIPSFQKSQQQHELASHNRIGRFLYFETKKVSYKNAIFTQISKIIEGHPVYKNTFKKFLTFKIVAFGSQRPPKGHANILKSTFSDGQNGVLKAEKEGDAIGSPAHSALRLTEHLETLDP